VQTEGFPKEERVRRGEEFTRILRRGRRVRGRVLHVYWIRDAGSPESANRVGVAVGKRLGRAVVRNRLKRLIREAYRRNKRELSCGGFAIVFVASSAMIGCCFREVEGEVVRLLRRVTSSSAPDSGR
jgi:ribonuclease P protein component